MRAVILAALALLAAPAAAQRVGGCGATAITRSEAADSVRLGSNADCFAQARMIAATAETIRRDRIATMAMPAPAVPPTPAPSLAGIAPVASGVKVEAHLVKSWTTGAIPQSEEGGAEGAFRFLCTPSHNAYDDPIIYPGQPGASHLHTFFGNSKADAGSTYASLRTTGESSCNNLLNRSAYWIAAMMNGHGKVVMPDYVSIYYKRGASTSPFCKPPYATACVPLPRGLRYVFGYNMQDPGKSAPAGSYYWNCDGPGAVSGHYASIGAAARGCPIGTRLGAVLSAPPCWNGKELDSKDHRSHMAWTAQDGYGHAACPRSHPYIVPQFTLGAWYTVDATLADWFLASDRMPGMPAATPGTTLHSDWFGAWEDSVQARWTANCIDKMLSCSGGDLGDGSQLATTAGYDYPRGRPLLDPPTRVMTH